VKALPYGKHVLRPVTHYGIGPTDIDQTIEAVAEAVLEFRAVAV
jgi:molybdopterin-biosynthesis enzyme MoeA-like protein